MATLAEIEAALRKADAAGNVEDARALAQAYREMAGQQNAVAPGPASPSQQPELPAAAAPNPMASSLPGLLGDFQNTLRAATSGAAQGLTFGWADEIAAAPFGVIDEIGKAIQGQGFDLGRGYQEALKRERADRDSSTALNPTASTLGEIAGGIGTGMAAGGQLAARGASLLPRVLTSGIVGTGQGALYGAGSSDDNKAGSALMGGLTGGVIGAAAPVAGALIGAGLRKAQPVVGAMRNAGREASRRTGLAFGRDAAANPQSVMNRADEAVARANNVPLMNVDRGGETTRALARSVANQSPEARATIEKAASDRFEGQAARAVDFMKRIAGGNVDDLAYQDNIRQMARLKNKPAYEAAYNAPAAQAVWSPNIRQLMQSDTFRQAVNMTTKRGTDFAAVSGGKAVRNPFVFREDGTVTLAKQPGGGTALPSLQFWDQVKRNLDGMIGVAKRGGDNQEAMVLTQMKQMLTGELDAVVPQYAAARSGAASFFDAEDALDAGKKFAGAPRALPEAQRAFGSMNQTEQQAFRTGFASEIIDRIKDTRFRTNVISQQFGSPAKREMMELVFGKARARELEAYIRVEELADKVRGAMGNSTTARQLMELGLATGGGAGLGFTLSGGNWQTAMQGAALGAGVKGAQVLGRRLDTKVMTEMARILTSDNPAELRKAVINASMSEKWMDVLRQLEQATAGGGRALSETTRQPALVPAP